MNRRLAAIAIVVAVPVHAWAGVEWAQWSGSGSTRTGTFSTGDTVTLTPRSFPGSGSVAAGGGFTCTPPAPGMSDSRNPPYQQILSGTGPGVLVNPGDVVVEIDLSDLPVGTPALFGIADQKFTYAFELRDGTDAVLPLTGIDVTPYHNQYPPAPPSFPEGLVADQNSVLLDGKLFPDFNNDAVPTDFYNQTGLTILSGLPAETREIRLLGAATAESEGLSLFVGIQVAGSINVTDTSGAAGDQAVTFGTVTVGAVSVTRKVTASNPGGAPVELVVTPAGLDESEFVITDGCSGSLAASASCDVTIAFHPTVAGALVGSLDFEVDGGEVVPVAVSGTGTLSKTGDTNGDGVTSAADALLALRIAVGTASVTDSILVSCDLNGDGKITAADALAILRKSVGL